MKKLALLSILLTVIIGSVTRESSFRYELKEDHLGGNVTPSQAFSMLQQDKNAVLIDIRTRAEYEFVGHPEGAFNIPFKFMTTKLGENGYSMSSNPHFIHDVLTSFDPDRHTLILICRSGCRTCDACNAAVKAGWKPENVFSVLGGFEGDVVKNEHSILYGQRRLNGWQNEGLPWTYKIERKLAYQQDVKLCKRQ